MGDSMTNCTSAFSIVVVDHQITRVILGLHQVHVQAAIDDPVNHFFCAKFTLSVLIDWKDS